ncbi:retrovirus-related pol polyprotein from transposon TNT 1-94 [Tanacetum coccineum]
MSLSRRCHSPVIDPPLPSLLVRTTTTKLLLLEDCCSDMWDTFINMEKSWMGTNRTNKSYIDGVAAFIDYKVHNLQKIRNIDLRVDKWHLLMQCLCTKCLNHIEHKVEKVQFHLFRNRIDLSYTNWTRYGEKDEPSISAPEPVNATTKFVDDTDFASDIPTDGLATVEMVNATKDNFDENQLGLVIIVIIRRREASLQRMS